MAVLPPGMAESTLLAEWGARNLALTSQFEAADRFWRDRHGQLPRQVVDVVAAQPTQIVPISELRRTFVNSSNKGLTCGRQH